MRPYTWQPDLPDHHSVKLGKAAPRYDSRTLKLATYLPASLPPIPPKTDYTGAVPTGNWGMMLNDSLGDCAVAAAGHMIMQWTASAGSLIVPSDVDIAAAYSAITGYTPSDPSTDRGTVELDLLNYWKQKGIAGHQIGGYAAVNHLNHLHVQAAVYLFGGLYLGVALPLSAQGMDTWDVPSGGAVGKGAAGSWGLHAVEVVEYDLNGLYVVTWGDLTRVTWQFWDAYVDEAYAVMSTDFLNGKGVTPAGFNLAQLQTDLAAVTN